MRRVVSGRAFTVGLQWRLMIKAGAERGPQRRGPLTMLRAPRVPQQARINTNYLSSHGHKRKERVPFWRNLVPLWETKRC